MYTIYKSRESNLKIPHYCTRSLPQEIQRFIARTRCEIFHTIINVNQAQPAINRQSSSEGTTFLLQRALSLSYYTFIYIYAPKITRISFIHYHQLRVVKTNTRHSAVVVETLSTSGSYTGYMHHEESKKKRRGEKKLVEIKKMRLQLSLEQLYLVSRNF